MSDSNFLYYSTKAKSHDLAKEYLSKTADFSTITPEDYSKMYLEIYAEIYNVLESNRLNKKK